MLRERPTQDQREEKSDHDHLAFDPGTGNVVASYDPATDSRSRKGQETVKVLQLDRREAHAMIYQRIYRRLCERVLDFLAAQMPDHDLAGKLKATDDHGLLGWVFTEAGSQDLPFAKLKADHPAVWSECARAFCS